MATRSLRLDYVTNEVDLDPWLVMYVHFLKCHSRLFNVIIQQLYTEIVRRFVGMLRWERGHACEVVPDFAEELQRTVDSSMGNISYLIQISRDMFN